MKKYFTLLFLLNAYFAMNAQEWTKLITKPNPNFYDMQNAFNKYYETHISSWEADDDYKAFKRWEYFMEPRVYPSGEFFNANATWEVLKSQKNSGNKTNQTAATSTWSALGPQFTANGLNGIGRVDCIYFDPTNSNTVWLGAAGGGLWKSTNSGSNWTDMSANLPNLSIANIAIHPTGTNTMYIATGDGFGYVTGSNVFWGGTYCTGVMKSTDGGVTWNNTALNYAVGQRQIVNRLIIHPNNPDTLIAVGTDGINQTTNGGATWTKVKSGKFYDAEFSVSNPDIIYAVRDSVFRSLDGGATWAAMPSSPKFTGRVAIETTVAKDSVIYVMDQTKKCVRSNDAGTTWNTITITGLTLYGYYDCVLSVSPIDANTVFAAGNNMVKTTNGGATWTTTGGTIHVDHHVIEFLPASATIYCGNDGGIYRSTNGGSIWTNFTSGLQITQFYRIGSSLTNPNIIYAGAQDNGTNRVNAGTWASVGGGDGMECLVDYSTSNIVYISSQNGVWSRSGNGGASFSGINTGSGAWTSPMVIHPTTNTTLFFGGKEVRKSTNSGTTFADISTNLSGGVNLIALAIAKSNPNYIYAAKPTSAYVTTNGGATWTTINTGLPLGTNVITYFAISATDPNTAWVTLSGYNAGQKVYKTVNAGTTWTNISGSLPNIPANCIVYDDNSSNDAIYVGTDLGVYYYDNTTPVWSSFNTGLPNVMIYELEINFTSQKIIAATYGRGIWESPITTIALGIKNPINTLGTISLYPNPTTGIFNLDINSTNGATKVKIEVFNLLGEKIYSVSDDFTKSQQYQIDLSKYCNGVYFVNVNTGFESRTERIVLNK